MYFLFQVWDDSFQCGVLILPGQISAKNLLKLVLFAPYIDWLILIAHLHTVAWK